MYLLQPTETRARPQDEAFPSVELGCIFTVPTPYTHARHITHTRPRTHLHIHAHTPHHPSPYIYISIDGVEQIPKLANITRMCVWPRNIFTRCKFPKWPPS